MKANRHPGGRRGSTHAHFAILIVTIVALLSLLAHEIWSSYRETIAASEARTKDYAALVGQRLDAALRGADSHLLEVQRHLPASELDGKTAERHRARWNAELDARVRHFPELAGLRVFDAGGDLLYSTDIENTVRANISDRPHFIEARDGKEKRPIISQVIFARTAPGRTATISRPIWGEAGNFRGMVVAGINFGYFLNLFESLKLGPNGSIGVYRSDTYTQMMRWPVNDVTINTPMPPDSPARKAIAAGAGHVTVQMNSSVDGVSRIYSAERIEGYPLFVIVGEAKTDVLAGWRERSALTGVIGIALLGLVIWLVRRLLATQRTLASINRDFETLLDQTTDFIYLKDRDSRIRFCSQSMADITGHTDWREMRGKHDREIVPAETAKIYSDEETPVLRDGIALIDKVDPYFTADGERRYVLTNKWSVKDESGRTVGIFGISRDITEIRRLQDELENQAHYDFLTGAANRRHFMAEASAELSRARRHDIAMSLLILDIDNFKRINDTWGHESGDLVLKHLANVCERTIRTEDLLGRIGGEEFAVLLPETDNR